MKDYYQNIFSAIYSGLPKILIFFGLLIFYIFLCDGITELSTKNEIARTLKSEIVENAQQPNDSIIVDKLYNCLSEEQFNDLISSSKSNTDNLNSQLFKLDDFNRRMLAKYDKTGKNLLQGIVTYDSSGVINSVNIYYLLFKSNEAFLKEIDFRYNQNQNKYNPGNISSIEVPIIKYSLPKTFIPNILIIFIIVQLIKLLYNLKRLNFSLKSSNEELKQLIVFYQTSFLPKISKVIISYYVVLSLSLLTIILIACNGLLLYDLEYPSSNFFYTAHKIFGWLNVIATVVLTVTLYFKLCKTRNEIRKGS